MAVLLLLQVPPDNVGVKVIADPTQSTDGPESVPAAGNGFTVIGEVVKALAQPVVTV